ncbi:hypothetical protein ACFH1L_30385, partial [Klebsiella michiganensis]
GGKNSLNRLIRCVCGKKIGPDPRNFNQRVSLGRNDLLIRTFLREVIKLKLYDNHNWYCIAILVLSFSFCLSMGFACKSSMTFSKSEWVKRK